MNRLSTLSAHVAPAPTASGGAWGQEYDFHDPPEPLYNTWSVPLPTPRPSPSPPRQPSYPLMRALILLWGGRCGADPTAMMRSKQKLLDGQQVFSYTIDKLDVELYLEVRKHYDFIWLEMQHSTMTYADVETMIAAGAATGEPGAIPFLRVPDELEGTFQKATDIGSLGLIVPTVDTPEQAIQVAKFSRFPPVARRSTGAGQAPKVWGNVSAAAPVSALPVCTRGTEKQLLRRITTTRTMIMS